MFAEEIRRAIEAASRIALPQVTAQLWRAFGDGHITEAEAESLSALIEARTLTGKAARVGQPSSPLGPQPAEAFDAPQALAGSARRSVGSRPRTDASMERRRRWAASGRLPPGLAARFTLAEQAVLALVAAETARRGDCRLAVGHLAAIVGVAETTVRNAIREASKLGLVTVEERRITGFRNDTNIVRIVAPEWTAWLRLARKTHPAHVPQRLDAAEGGGCKSAQRTHTQVLIPLDSRITQPSKGCRKAAGDLDRATPSRIRQGGRKTRAMR
ncbi:GntR family transcriptional regulator [Methylobacterium sp. yr668]|uniref:GntR family transcriptional regulator n=1 Tax=Methylobacterium sp. yr668 TaxID=1761801 RepID=UPI0008F153F3|nr:GntR family transcriptional regulator [Methylobacterium sp. yr668]SFT27025.1 regulatory protein, gntR family [Methylobacterium sp. yr668]